MIYLIQFLCELLVDPPDPECSVCACSYLEPLWKADGLPPSHSHLHFLPASPRGPNTNLNGMRLVSGLVNSRPPLQILSGVKVSLLNSKASVLLGGHGQKREVDQVQGEIDPGDGDQGLVETEAFGDVPDDSGGTVVGGVVALGSKGDGDTCRREERGERRVSQTFTMSEVRK
jgi:hypothetical protein